MGRTSRLFLGLGALILGAGLYWLLGEIPAQDPLGAPPPDVPPQPESAAETFRDHDSGRLAESSANEDREAAGMARLEERGAQTSESERFIVVVRVHEEPSKQLLEGVRVAIEHESCSAQALTDSMGECRLQVPKAMDYLPLRLEKAGYFHRMGQWSPSRLLEIDLTRTATLMGFVFDAETGRPVPGARVQHEHQHRGCEPDVAIAGADGSYELPAVPLHVWTTFVVGADGYVTEAMQFEVRSNTSRAEQDFRLGRGMLVEGRVMDFQSAIPLPGARVSGVADRGFVKTDEQGRFSLRMAEPSAGKEYEIDVFQTGYCRFRGAWSLEQLRATAPLEIRLPRPTIVEGFVRTDRGEPVPGARVYLMAKGEGGRSLGPSPLDNLAPRWQLESADNLAVTSTDSSGHFVIDNAVPWVEGWVLDVYAEGFGFVRVHPGLDRTLGPGQRVRADVSLVARPDPPPHARVRGRITLNGGFARRLEGEVIWNGAQRSGRSDFLDGEYHVDVEPGACELRVVLTGLDAPLEGGILHLEVSEGDAVVRDVDLRTATAWIRGRVILDSGAPLAGAEVAARCTLGVVPWGFQEVCYTATTDLEGAYGIEVPDWAFAYRVSATFGSLSTAIEGVTAGTQGVDLTLATPGSVLVRARTPGSRPRSSLYEFMLLWRATGEDSFEVLPTHPGMVPPDGDGWFLYTLACGSCELRLIPEQGSGLAFAPGMTKDVWVRQDAPTRVEFELVEGVDVLFHTTPKTSGFPGGRRVLLLEQYEWDGLPLDSDLGLSLSDIFSTTRTVQFDANGRWLAKNLAPGTFRFQSFPGGLVFEPSVIELTQDGPSTVEIDWQLDH